MFFIIYIGQESCSIIDMDPNFSEAKRLALCYYELFGWIALRDGATGKRYSIDDLNNVRI